MNRAEILNAAGQAICHDRQDAYGGTEDNFKRIADLWAIYLEIPIKAHDVACMMAMLKIARIKTGAAQNDNWIDIAGYAACGGELQARLFSPES